MEKAFPWKFLLDRRHSFRVPDSQIDRYGTGRVKRATCLYLHTHGQFSWPRSARVLCRAGEVVCSNSVIADVGDVLYSRAHCPGRVSSWHVHQSSVPVGRQSYVTHNHVRGRG